MQGVYSSGMRNCDKCQENRWTFTGEGGMVICTCACGNVVSFKSGRKKRKEEYVKRVMVNTRKTAQKAMELHETLIRKLLHEHNVDIQEDRVKECLTGLYEECFPWLLEKPIERQYKERNHEKKAEGLYPQEVRHMKTIEYYLALAQKKITQ